MLRAGMVEGVPDIGRTTVIGGAGGARGPSTTRKLPWGFGTWYGEKENQVLLAGVCGMAATLALGTFMYVRAGGE